MGSIFARPPARAAVRRAAPARRSRSTGAPTPPLADAVAAVQAPVVLCVGAERAGLPEELLAAADAVAQIPIAADGPESLNVAMAATIGLYERE